MAARIARRTVAVARPARTSGLAEDGYRGDGAGTAEVVGEARPHALHLHPAGATEELVRDVVETMSV